MKILKTNRDSPVILYVLLYITVSHKIVVFCFVLFSLSRKQNQELKDLLR